MKTLTKDSFPVFIYRSLFCQIKKNTLVPFSPHPRSLKKRLKKKKKKYTPALSGLASFRNQLKLQGTRAEKQLEFRMLSHMEHGLAAVGGD